MRVIDPAWIGMKLRKLLNVGEPLGHFMAPMPGERRQQLWPSTVAYIARLVIHRYAMLGVLDEAGFPLREMGILQTRRRQITQRRGRADGRRALPGMRQPDADPQRRLRLLHHLRLHRRVWVRQDVGQSLRTALRLPNRPRMLAGPWRSSPDGQSLRTDCRLTNRGPHHHFYGAPTTRCASRSSASTETSSGST